jgi:hypothetical protein
MESLSLTKLRSIIVTDFFLRLIKLRAKAIELLVDDREIILYLFGENLLGTIKALGIFKNFQAFDNSIFRFFDFHEGILDVSSRIKV